MNRRCITRTAGATAGGLLGAAFLPVAIALADDYTITPDTTGSTEVVTGLYGLDTAPPAVNGSLQGYQLFTYDDTTASTAGTFDADESTASDAFGDTNQEVLVTSDASGPDAPPVGSVFDTYTLGGDSGFANIYSDLASTTPGEDVISDTLVTPFGNIAIPVTLDAAAVSGTGAMATALVNDYGFVPTSTPEAITGISGLPPLDVAIQGTQSFAVGDAGSFGAAVTNTSDAFGFSTEAVLVTSTSGADVGMADGDVPPVGSVFNIIAVGDSGFENVYSTLPSTGGDVVSDTLVTPFGDIAMPVTFDAAADTAAGVSYALGDGDSLVSTSTEELTGINGVPPLDADIQGYQAFDVDNSTGAIGSFDADVSTSVNPNGGTDEAILVTSTSGGDVGTAAGEVPPVGSVFDIYNFGSGFETIYSDLPSTTAGGDVISDTFVTPLGDFTIPLTWDAFPVVAGDSFSDPLSAAVMSLFGL